MINVTVDEVNNLTTLGKNNGFRSYIRQKHRFTDKLGGEVFLPFHSTKRI